MISVVSVRNIFGAPNTVLVPVSWHQTIFYCPLPSESRFGDCHVPAVTPAFSSAQCCHDHDSDPVKIPGRHWLKWQYNTQVPGGWNITSTSLHWAQVVTGDCLGHRDLLQVLYWQSPDADIALVTHPSEVSWYHLIILSFVPILKFRGYTLTTQCLVKAIKIVLHVNHGTLILQERLQ